MEKKLKTCNVRVKASPHETFTPQLLNCWLMRLLRAVAKHTSPTDCSTIWRCFLVLLCCSPSLPPFLTILLPFQLSCYRFLVCFNWLPPCCSERPCVVIASCAWLAQCPCLASLLPLRLLRYSWHPCRFAQSHTSHDNGLKTTNCCLSLLPF